MIEPQTLPLYCALFMIVIGFLAIVDFENEYIKFRKAGENNNLCCTALTKKLSLEDTKTRVKIKKNIAKIINTKNMTIEDKIKILKRYLKLALKIKITDQEAKTIVCTILKIRIMEKYKKEIKQTTSKERKQC